MIFQLKPGHFGNYETLDLIEISYFSRITLKPFQQRKVWATASILLNGGRSSGSHPASGVTQGRVHLVTMEGR